jgi:hypothetical protein
VTTRSTKLGVVTPAVNTATILFNCPTGFRAIVKSLIVTSFAATGAKTTALLQDGGGAGYLYLENQTTTPYVPLFWSGWVMMHASDGIVVQTDQATTTFWLSGTLLPYP